MARTEERQRGSRKLTDKEARFVQEYTKDYNASGAARRAGYRSPDSQGDRLLKRPRVAAAIGKLRKEERKKFEIEREEILLQLLYLATRSGADFVDANGKLIDNVNDLPVRAQQAVDGIKQKVRRWVADDGTTIEEVETELKLCSKISAIDMAMKHKGLYETSKQDVRITIDLDLFTPSDSEPENIIDSYIEQKHIEGLEDD